MTLGFIAIGQAEQIAFHDLTSSGATLNSKAVKSRML